MDRGCFFLTSAKNIPLIATTPRVLLIRGGGTSFIIRVKGLRFLIWKAQIPLQFCTLDPWSSCEGLFQASCKVSSLSLAPALNGRAMLDGPGMVVKGVV